MTAARAALPFAAGAAFVAAVLLTTSLRLEGTAAYLDPGWDRHYYREAAERGPLAFHVAPYCWRVLVPAVAWALGPIPLAWSFLFAAVLGAVVAGGATWLAARELGHPASRAAGALALLFATGWGLRYQLADFWLPDAVASGAFALCILFALRGQPRAFAATLAVGVLAKESVLAAAPLAVMLGTAERRWPWRLLVAGVAVAPALAGALAVRWLVPAWNDDAGYIASLPPVISRFPEIVAGYDYRVLVRDIGWDERVRGFDLELARAMTTGTFGWLAVGLAVAGCAGRPRLALALAPSLLLVEAQLLVARDTERLVAFGAPAVVLLAAEGAALLERRGLLAAGEFAVLAFGAFALALSGGREAFGLNHGVHGLLFALGLGVVLVRSLQRRAWRATPRG